jgi:hypothetical protein
MTGALLIILAFILVLGLLIPQQATLDTTVAVWTASLPLWLQAQGEPLFLLGLARIFQSLWFWIPLALLLLHSLVSVADYAWPSWQRTRPMKSLTALEWQHPLAQRVEYSIRLPAAPNEYLSKLKGSLIAAGFSIDASFEEEARVVSAVRQRWGWLEILIFYGGLILLSSAFLLGHNYLTAERLTLLPLEPRTSHLFGGTLELVEIDAVNYSGVVVYRSRGDDQSFQELVWQLYRPAFFNKVLVWPAAIEPIVTIEVRNAAGEAVTLLPLLEELPPTTQLNVPLAQVAEPLYFLIPSVSLAFQISPVPGSNDDDYNVQVRRGKESSPSENRMVKLGKTFDVDGLAMTVSRNYDLKFVARRDWALLLYFVVLTLVIVISAALLFFRPPWQLWLVPEVKGRGGQLYGVVEKFGSARDASEFLKQLLAEGTSLEEADT